MKVTTFEEGIALEELSPDVYQSVNLPWTWPATPVVPGGIIMALAGAAAYKTVADGFSLKKLEAHFLSGPDADEKMRQEVQRVSDSGRFGTRVVTVMQGATKIAHITCSFVRTSAMGGPSMTHTVRRATDKEIEDITLDDLEPGLGLRGPYMKFQRLPLASGDESTPPKDASPESLVYTSAARIAPPISSTSEHTQILGIVCLSDYHILDCPPTLHGYTFGLPRIDDHSRTLTPMNFDLYTTLNHNVHFRLQKGFRADDLCYVEVSSPWAGERRAAVRGRIFDRRGDLIATCEQEAYYVLKRDAVSGKL